MYTPRAGQKIEFAYMKDNRVCAGYSGLDEEGGFHIICDVSAAVEPLLLRVKEAEDRATAAENRLAFVMATAKALLTQGEG